MMIINVVNEVVDFTLFYFELDAVARDLVDVFDLLFGKFRFLLPIFLNDVELRKIKKLK